MPETRTKVFQIGFNKCGTRSLKAFFKKNGFRCVHWDDGKLAKAMFKNKASGRSLICGYEQFDVFTDMENMQGKNSLEAYKLYPDLAKEFPDALFILNTRDRERWIGSRLRHREGKLAENWKAHYGVTTDEELIAQWTEDWDAHHRQVKDFFHGSSYRFLVFDIEKDSPERLVEALPEANLDPRKYDQVGSTADRIIRKARRRSQTAAEAPNAE
jgi:hypothetical protein